jgi:hypothetical protein
MRMLVAVLLVVSAVVIQGCASSEETAQPEKTTAGTAKYSLGTLKSVEPASIDKVYDATQKAMEELKLAVLQKNADSMSGEVVVRDVADKKIVISLAATTDGKTSLAIKVGMLGDESKSRLIYEQIKKKIQ